MGAASNLRFEPATEPSQSISARMLRLWCAPGTILAVTNLGDEEALLFHLIRQARRSSAKVLLAHVLQSSRVRADPRQLPQRAESSRVVESAQESLTRMAQQLRWVGIPCEPLLLRGSAANEISLVAEARGAQRLLMLGACAKDGGDGAPKTLAEELLPRISIPICTVGQHGLALPQLAASAARVTLALSLESDAELPLAFASRLAQEHKAQLTVVHVFGRDDKVRDGSGRTPLAVASRLPANRLREAELLCPLEIAIRTGDPATEILKFGAGTDQDLIVLGPAGLPRPVPAGNSSVVHRVITEARCPVIVLGQSMRRSAFD